MVSPGSIVYPFLWKGIFTFPDHKHRSLINIFQMAKNSSGENRQIATHVFTGSTTMIGVCTTVIALFHGLKVSMQSYADELLGIDNFIFIAAALFAYSAMRKEDNSKLELWADRLFFTGMIIMLLVGVVIVLSAY
jgi:hypothetical protein